MRLGVGHGSESMPRAVREMMVILKREHAIVKRILWDTCTAILWCPVYVCIHSRRRLLGI